MAAATARPLLPLDIELPEGHGTLRCQSLVRFLPGRRWVCSGVWNGRPVFIKLFLARRRSRVHWQRETTGVRAMMAGGIPTPTLLLSTQLTDGRLVNVYQRIDPAIRGTDAWQAALVNGETWTVLAALVDTVAAHHQAGLVQYDVHADNFLFSEGLVLTVDGGGVRVSGAVVKLHRALFNLGALLAQFQPLDERTFEQLLCRYCRARGLNPRHCRRAVASACRRISRYRQGAYLRKAYRDSTAFAVYQDWRWRRIFERGFDGPQLRELLFDPDRFLQDSDAEIIKAGNTCTVWRSRVDGRRLVVKRYNIKNWRHRLGRAWRRTRASRSWQNGLRLRFLGLPTARPVALVEQRRGPLRGKAWLITEWQQGVAAGAYFASVSDHPEVQSDAARELVTLLRLMAARGIVHGDTKASNYLMVDDCPVVIDLDPMRVVAGAARLRRAYQRDLRRFRANWDLQQWQRWFEPALSEPLPDWGRHCWQRSVQRPAETAQ